MVPQFRQVGKQLHLLFANGRGLSRLAFADNPSADSFVYKGAEEQLPGPDCKYRKSNPDPAGEDVPFRSLPAERTGDVILQSTRDHGTFKVNHGTDLEEAKQKGCELLWHAEPSSMEVQAQTEPSIDDLTRILRMCRHRKNLGGAMRAHTLIYRMGLEAHPSLGDHLVSMLVEVGSLHHAQCVFDMLEFKSESSWNSLITGFAKSGELDHACLLYESMQKDASLETRSHTMVALLNACGRRKEFERGCSLHVDIARKGILVMDVYVGSTLVDMYAKCGFLGHAQDVFDMLSVQSVVSWNGLIAGYMEHAYEEIALSKFEQMQREGCSPSVVTFVCILKACVTTENLCKGQIVHMDIVKRGLESGMYLGSILVDMYAKSDTLGDAQNVFDRLTDRDMVSWTALIAGYGEHGLVERALELFKRMQQDNITPSAVTFVCCLKACARARLTPEGQEIHSEAVKKGLERETVIGSTLVDLYARGNLLLDAQCVFDKILKRDIVLWTTLLAGYTDNGYFEESLKHFNRMRQENGGIEVGLLVCCLKACGGTESITRGLELHSDAVKAGLESWLPIGNIVVDMYTKCGALEEAQDVFDKLTSRDVISWTSLLSGYAQLGECERVIKVFDRMIGGSLEPNLITFLSVLNACSNAGLIEEGQMYFDLMINSYLLTPTLEHFACLADLLGRTGLIDDAFALIVKMPFHPTVVVWLTVLAACRKWGDIQGGKHAFEQAVSLNHNKASVFLCMFNIYADADVHEY